MNTESGSFYQSLTVKATESEYDQINNTRNTSKETSPSFQTEYDTIPTTTTTVFSSSLDNQPITTNNSLYASRGDTLKHPTLLKGDQQLQYYQLSPVPESIFTAQDKRSLDGGSSCCKCSMNAMLFLLSVLTILLSIMAITLVLLMQFGVISAQLNFSSSQGQSLQAGVSIAINPSSITTLRDQSSSLVLFPSSIPTRLTPSPSCNCTDSIDISDNTPNFDVHNIYASIRRVSEGIERLRADKNISANERVQLLSDYLSQIKSINDSLQQLRPQANQPRSPILTGLNHTVDLQFDSNASCTIHTEISCTARPGFGNRDCNTANVPFLEQTSGLIIVNFHCNISPHDGSIGQGAATVFLTLPPSDLELSVEDLASLYSKCHCFAFGSTPVDCGYTVTRCPTNQVIRTAQISVLT